MTDPVAPQNPQPFADEDKIMLFLAYFGLLSLVPFLMFKDKQADPQKEYVYWHGREGLALCLAEFAASFVLGIILFVLSIVTFGFASLLFPCIGLVFIVPNIIAWIKAFKGEKWEIPLVHNIAKMFN